MQGRDIVVVGASAGGVEALLRLLPGLPGDLHAAVFVALHISPKTHDVLAGLLAPHLRLAIGYASDREKIARARVYLARAGHDLLIERGRVRVRLPAPGQVYQPSIDALFMSAAAAYGARVIGVVLSGARRDGAAGAAAIKARGGLVVVQDPAEAEFRDMPEAAMLATDVDYRSRLAHMPALLASLTAPPPATHARR